ncbi:hypothetical protein [Massilia sp. BKSP1R2A-1]|uniref:hypothetical protein n=1 Tax=Massilia sp. BKSP1R2A-1 TaxID=3422595 RepID=UPI003D3532B0
MTPAPVVAQMQEEISKFFNCHIDEIDLDGGGGSWPKPMAFELGPRDFLDFAEADLNAGISTHTLVNATSNLKRAVDCQLDHFLHVLNLDQFYRRKRLGVDRKLGLLKKSGIFRSRSIEKLNALRNRLEHHYEAPVLEDVEVYFDLVAAFVSVVEAAIPLAGTSSEVSFTLMNGGRIDGKFSRDEPRMLLLLEHSESSYSRTFEANMSYSKDASSDLDRFAYLLRVHMLLRKWYDGCLTDRQFLKAIGTAE